MIIKSIELKNFGIHQNHKFNFSTGVNAIVGRNGTGKSTIISAIGIALFNAFINTSDFISYGRDTAKITINFLFKNKSFILAREFGKVSSTVLTGDDFTIKGNKEVYNYLATLLSIDLKQYFLNILRIKSSSITYPFTIEQSKRKLIFDDILNINKYNNIYMYLREPQRELELIISNLEKQLHFNKGKLDNKDRYIREIDKLLLLLEQLESKQKEYSNYKSKLDLKFQIHKDINKAERERTALRDRLNQLILEQGNIEDYRCYVCKSTIDINTATRLLEEVKKENNDLTVRDKILSELLMTLKQELDSIYVPQIKDYSSDISKSQGKLELLKQELSELDKIDLAQISMQISEQKRKLERLTKIRDGFKVLPQVLAKYSTNDISNFSSELLSQLMDGDVRVEFSSTYNTVIEFDGKRLQFDQLSDGQQIMCALAIRLAVNKLFSDSVDFLILDEPGISLDATSLSLLEENIKSLGFPQILLISHDTLFSAHADNTIGL